VANSPEASTPAKLLEPAAQAKQPGAHLLEPADDRREAQGEQAYNHQSVKQRLADIAAQVEEIPLFSPGVVQNDQDPGGIDQPVKALPVLAQAFDRPFGCCGCQGE
jgi:alkylation response protein AidB-like acyl-CoA dehydrogenase